MIAAVSADDAVVVVVIVAAFLLDALDNGLLGGLTDVDLSAGGPYQSWDKALDVYYLSIAYLSTMRNWASLPAFRVGQFLFYYRLVGNVLFELLQSRAMLLVFPNTFEFFFIAYEAIRARSPSHGRRLRADPLPVPLGQARLRRLCRSPSASR